jgi:hypothetical protein
MIPIISPRPASHRVLVARRVAKSLLLLSVIGCGLACVSCNEQGSPIVDVTPLGDGLKVIGYAVVAAAVLLVLGKLVK